MATRKQSDPRTHFLTGVMMNQLVTAQIAVHSMVAISNVYAFEPVTATTNAVLIRKSVAARSVISAVEKQFELTGGTASYQILGRVRLLCDVHGAQFHP